MRGQKRVEDARRRAGVPRIHVCGEASKMWMAGTGPGTGPGMTNAKRQTVKTTVSRHWTAEIWRGFGPDPMKRAVVPARIMRRGMRSA